MPILLAAPFAEVFIAVAVMLLAWAVTTLLTKPLVYLLQHVPVVGYSIGRAVEDAVGEVIRWALNWAAKAVDALVQLVAVPVMAVVNFVNMLAQTAEALAAAIVRVAAVAAGQVGTLADRIANLVARVAGLVASVATIWTSIHHLSERIAAVLSSAIPAAINAVRAWVRSFVTGAIDVARHALQLAINAIRPWVYLAIATALAPLWAAIALIRPWVLAAVAVAVQPLTWGLENLGRVLGDAVAAILARLAILEKLLPLIALVPLVGMIARVIEDHWLMRRKCVDPTCDLLGGLLQGIGAAGELLTGSVLVYLVTRAIDDPAGTAAEVHGWAPELRSMASEVTTVLANRAA